MECILKTAIVTGVSGKIGSEIAVTLIKDGYFVFGTFNKNEKGIEQVTERLNGEQKDMFFAYSVDLKDRQKTQNFVETVYKSVRHVDLIVNNAGIDLIKPITDCTETDYENVFGVNVKGTIMLTNLILPDMISRKSGKIINVSSVWGKVGASCEVLYSASKSAIIGYTKALAKELAESKINVNCVCPGVIDSPMNDCFTNEEKQDIISEIPFGKMGTAKDVSELIKFLASESANYITGEIITVDGGYTL